MLSGRPWVSFAKWVNLAVAKLFELITHEPSAVPILRRASPPVPVVGAALAANRSLVSVLFESR